MADITESAVWEDSIYELATTDPVKGGTPVIGGDGSVVSGHANVQAQKLANRTKYLKQRVDAWPEKVDAAGTALGLINAHNNDPRAHHPWLTDFITSEADRAEAAADVSVANGKIYPDTFTGISNTAPDQYFSTPSADSTEYLILYKNTSGSATEVKRYPSSELVKSINQQISGQYPSEFRQNPTLTGTAENISRTRIEGTLFAQAGFLKSVIVYAQTAGSAKIKVVRKTGELTYSLISEFSVNLEVGQNVFTSGIDFFGIDVTTSDTLAVASIGARISVTQTGVSGASFIFNGDLTGSDRAVLTTVNYIQIKAVVGVGLSYSEIIDSVEQLNGEQMVYAVLPPGTGTTENASRTRISSSTFSQSGELKSVSVYINTPGTGKIKLLERKSEGVFSFLQDFEVTCTAGINTFVSGVDYPIINVKAGNVLGFYGITARPASVLVSTENSSYIYSGDILGDSVATTGNSYVLQIGAVVEVSPSFTSTSEMASAAYNASVENSIAIANLNPVSVPEVSALLRGKTSSVSQNFTGTSTPASWVLSGAVWSVNNGLRSTGTGSISTIAYYNQYSTVSRKITRTRFKLLDETSVFGLQWLPQRSTRGSAVVVNGVSGTLELSLFTGSTVTLSKSVQLADPLTAGREYLLESRKIGISTVITFTDTVTQSTTTLSQSQGDGSADAGAQHGKPGLMHLSGDVEVKSFDVVTQSGKDPYIVIIGDSICEGSSNEASWASCWPYLIDEQRARGDILISAKGGNTTSNALDCCLTDLDPFSPTYVLLAVGTNDTNQDSFRVGYAALIARVLARGATPVLVTQVPRPAKQSQVDAQNLDITSGYFGNYPIINAATALGGVTGSNFNSAYYVGDGVHPNSTGQLLIKRQVEIDLPDVFE